jgi:hypothetical protein
MGALVVVDIGDFKNRHSGLFREYMNEKTRIETVSKVFADNFDTFYYFAKGNTRDSYIPASFVELKGAIKALNASYWRKAIYATGVMELLPSKQRDDWENKFDTMDVPEFTPESVYSTIEEILLNRGNHFLDKVDGVFHSLSPEHITNSPSGFKSKLIINSVVDTKFLSPNHNRCGTLDDLSAILYTVNGVPPELYGRAYYSVYSITSEENRWGEWVEMDGGFYKIKLHKSGTAHIMIDELTALKLNRILSQRYPNAIPAKAHTIPKKYKKSELEKEFFPFNVLSGIYDKFRSGKSEAYVSDKEEKRILIRLGGKETEKNTIKFDSSPIKAISELYRCGYLYKAKSTQFYPTKVDLAQEMADLLEISDGMSVLEPSAGQGSLISAVNDLAKVDFTAIEIDPINALIIEEDFSNVDLVNGDFLDMKEEEKFDRIIMNPPFSDGRAKRHVEKALTLLSKDGVLVACLPASLKGHVFDEKLCHEYSEVKEDMFDGTSVRVVLLKLS